MPILLPERSTTAVHSLTPREVVLELDKYVIGQAKAKRAVAIALRNRVRRQRLPKEMADEVSPKNILMIGPTGVGKTEIARRLARLAGAPFVKVEASKFTEVGYVGRDVEGMVRDLVDSAIDMVRRAEIGKFVRIVLYAEFIHNRQSDDAAAGGAVEHHLQQGFDHGLRSCSWLLVSVTWRTRAKRPSRPSGSMRTSAT